MGRLNGIEKTAVGLTILVALASALSVAYSICR